MGRVIRGWRRARPPEARLCGGTRSNARGEALDGTFTFRAGDRTDVTKEFEIMMVCIIKPCRLSVSLAEWLRSPRVL